MPPVTPKKNAFALHGIRCRSRDRLSHRPPPGAQTRAHPPPITARSGHALSPSREVPRGSLDSPSGLLRTTRHEHPGLARRRATAREAARPAAPQALSDAELLALLLGARARAAPRRSIWRARCSRHFGSLRELLSARARRAASARAGVGPARYADPAGGAGAGAPALPRGAALGSGAGRPGGDTHLSPGAAARPALRGVLLPVPGQPPSADRLRGAVPRHHRPAPACIRARCCARRWPTTPRR